MLYSATTNRFYNEAVTATPPKDAVTVDQQTLQQLLQGQTDGQQITPGPDGYPCLTPRPVEPVTLDQLCADIDLAADMARRAVAGDPLRAVEYERAAAEAQAFKDAGYQGDVPPMVAAWAIGGRTAQQAAESILAEAAQYNGALVQLRTVRLQAKELIRAAINAGNIELAQDIAAETIASIEAAVAGIGNNAS